MTYQYVLDGLNCASCAQKIESAVQNFAYIESAELNFVTKLLTITPKKDQDSTGLLLDTKEIVQKLEPHVKVIPVEEDVQEPNAQELVFDLDGLHCTSCATKIDARLKDSSDLKEAALNFVSKTITVCPQSGISAEHVNKIVQETVHHFEPDVGVVMRRNSEKKQLEENAEGNTFIGLSKQTLRLGSALALFAGSFFVRGNETLIIALTLTAYAIAGLPVLTRAFKGNEKRSAL